jgi:YgiT-type zinc finger domain-containing protein
MRAKPIRYGRCESCGGPVIGRRLTVDRRFHGQLFEFENVPVGVCCDCGQRVYKGRVLEQLEHLAQSKSRIKRTIRVPVAEFRAAGA